MPAYLHGLSEHKGNVSASVSNYDDLAIKTYRYLRIALVGALLSIAGRCS